MDLLKDMLTKRHLYDLLNMAASASLKAPSSMTEEDWETALSFGRGEDREETIKIMESYLLQDPEDESGAEELLRGLRGKKKKAMEEHLRKNRMITKSLTAADRACGEIAEGIAEYLLDREVMTGHLMKSSDRTIGILRDLSERDLRGEREEIYSLDLPWKDCGSADKLEEWGYAIVQELKPAKSADEHRYVTGITVPGDVLELFRRIYTPETDLARRKNNLVYECCLFARSYYQTAPVSLVMEICRIYAEGDPSAPAVTMEELIKFAGETQGDFYFLLENEGELFIADSSVMDDLNLTEDWEETVFHSDLEKMKNHGDAFYIPSAKEVLDYSRNGYWSEREAWKEARQWFTEYYLDEKYMESIFPGMLGMAYGKEAENMDIDIYSMDDVEEKTKDLLLEAVWFFMDDCSVKDYLDEKKEITLSVPEEAKERLIRILEECLAQTNKRCYMGHMSEEDMEACSRKIRQKA